jgi:hypothetical protein
MPQAIAAWLPLTEGNRYDKDELPVPVSMIELNRSRGLLPIVEEFTRSPKLNMVKRPIHPSELKL